MNEILENPVTGESIRVLESNADVFTIEFALHPGGAVAGTHIHPREDQRLSVKSGTLVCHVGGKEVVIRAGESVLVPMGTPHDQSNPSDVDAIAIEEYRPAGQMHGFFRAFFALARNGHTNAKGVPSPLFTAALFDEFRDSVLPGPLGLRVLIHVLAPLARLLGYRRTIQALAESNDQASVPAARWTAPTREPESIRPTMAPMSR